MENPFRSGDEVELTEKYKDAASGILGKRKTFIVKDIGSNYITLVDDAIDNRHIFEAFRLLKPRITSQELLEKLTILENKYNITIGV